MKSSIVKRIVAGILLLTVSCTLCGCSEIHNVSGFQFDFSAICEFFKNLLPRVTVTFDLNYDGAEYELPPQTVKFSEKAVMEIPQRDMYAFAGWYSDPFCMQYFNFNTNRLFFNRTVYAKWVDVSDTTDTDGDGLTDVLEEAYRTNKRKPDTDGDGISDYYEIEFTGTNPKERDTDGNSVADGEEDFDGDTLLNLEEISNNTNPMLLDSDSDGCSDDAEINQYKTNPNLADTDGDGASDGVEIQHHTDPNHQTTEFVQVLESEAISENNAVSLRVSVKLPPENFGTASVTTVTAAENPFITGTIPGYLGKAYELTAAGEIESATMEFTYDTALGTIGSSFQPRVYWLNESNHCFEEVPNQKISPGKVVAYTTHFSTYILLNKVEFEKVWEHDIKPPVLDSHAFLDVAFAIDISASMTGERLNTAKQALNTFILALEEKDRAAVVDFHSYSSVVSDLTANKSEVIQRVNSLQTTGQTAMYTGLQSALNILTRQQDYGYRMIVILSDGHDVPMTFYGTHYADLVRYANQNQIMIYTVGVGDDVDTEILRRVAEETGGSYYHATSTQELTTVFSKLQKETIDYTTDSNDDGISDYFTELIRYGILQASNASVCFAGVDLSGSADYDNDGLKNGEELIVTVENDRVYMKMLSNPIYRDTDHDGYSDGVERQMGMDPLRISYLQSDIGQLFNNELYCGYLLAEKYETDPLFKISVGIVNIMDGNWTPTRECQATFLDYFESTASVQEKEGANAMYIMLRTANQALDTLNNEIIANLDQVDDTLDYAEKAEEMKVVFARIKALVDSRNKVHNTIDQIDLSGKTYTKSYVKEWTKSFTKAVDAVADKFPAVKKVVVPLRKAADGWNTDIFAGLSVGDVITIALKMEQTVTDYAKLMSNMDLYQENLMLLDYVSIHGKNHVIRSTAQQLAQIIRGDCGLFIQSMDQAIASDLLSGVGDNAVGTLAVSNPYSATVYFAFQVLDIGFGLGDKAQNVKKAYYLSALTDAAYAKSKDAFHETGSGYTLIYKDPSVGNRCFTHLAQLRIAGEDIFLDFANNKGLLLRWFNQDYDEALEFCTDTKNKVRSCATRLNVTLAEPYAEQS